MRQKTRQLVLPLDTRGETPRSQRSGEASTAASGNERPGTDRLMEEVVQRGNAKAALKRVRQNKGSPGVDGMTVDELPEYLAEHWEAIREELLAGTYQPTPVKRQEIPTAQLCPLRRRSERVRQVQAGGRGRHADASAAVRAASVASQRGEERGGASAGSQVPRLQLLGSQGARDQATRRAQGPCGDEGARPGNHGPKRWPEHEDGVRRTAQLPRGMEAVLPPRRDAAHFPRPGRVDPPSAAAGAAQTVEAREDHLPGDEAPRCTRGRGPAGGWELATLVEELQHAAQRRPAHELLRPSRSPEACWLTSTT